MQTDRSRNSDLTAAERGVYEGCVRDLADLRKKPELKNRLPIVEQAKKIEAALRNHDVICVQAPTGAGKSLDLGVMVRKVLGPASKTAMTQPRRDAARNVCLATAARHDLKFGPDISFSTSDFHGNTAETTLQIQTTRILLNQFRSDPMLLRYNAVIVDEAHERDLNIDVSLGLLKRANKLRGEEGKKPLKIIIASATLQEDKFAHFFNIPKEAIVESEGRMFPVEKKYVRPEQKFIAREGLAETQERPHTELAAEQTIDFLRSSRKGDVLVFMPGMRDMEQTRSLVERALVKNRLEKQVEVLLLHGENSSKERSNVLGGKPKGDDCRRVIISTGIAETSVTVPDIKCVVDSGLKKEMWYDPETGLETLTTVRATKANCEQRAGRAGRVSPGEVRRLFTQEEFDAVDEEGRPNFSDHPEPEIKRLDLAATVLHMIHLGIKNIEQFDFIDPPPPEHLKTAIELLEALGAITADRKLTEKIGKEMVKLPLDPRLARVVVAARELGCIQSAVAVVSMVGRNDVFDGPQKRDYKEAEAKLRELYPGQAVLNQDRVRDEAGQIIFERQKKIKEGFASDLDLYRSIFFKFLASSNATQFCDENGLDFDVLERAEKQYYRILKELGKNEHVEDDPAARSMAVSEALLTGFAPDHLLTLVPSKRIHIMYCRLDRGNTNVRITSGSVAKKVPLGVCLRMAPGDGQAGQEFIFAVGVHPVTSRNLHAAIPHLVGRSEYPLSFGLNDQGQVVATYAYDFKTKAGKRVVLPNDSVYEISPEATRRLGKYIAEQSYEAVRDPIFNCEENNKKVALLQDLQIRSRGAVKWSGLATWYAERLKGYASVEEAKKLGEKKYVLSLQEFCSDAKRAEIEERSPQKITLSGHECTVSYEFSPAYQAGSGGYSEPEHFNATINLTRDSVENTYRLVAELRRSSVDKIRSEISSLQNTDRLLFVAEVNYGVSRSESLAELEEKLLEAYLSAAFEAFEPPTTKEILVSSVEVLPNLDDLGAEPQPYATRANGDTALAFPAVVLQARYNEVAETEETFCVVNYYKTSEEASENQAHSEQAFAKLRFAGQRQQDRGTVLENGQTMLEYALERYRSAEELLRTLYYNAEERQKYGIFEAQAGALFKENMRAIEKLLSIGSWADNDSDPRQALILLDEINRFLNERQLAFGEIKEKVATLQPLYDRVKILMAEKLDLFSYSEYGINSADYDRLKQEWKEAGDLLKTSDYRGDMVLPKPERAQELLEELERSLSGLEKVSERENRRLLEGMLFGKGKEYTQLLVVKDGMVVQAMHPLDAKTRVEQPNSVDIGPSKKYLKFSGSWVSLKQGVDSTFLEYCLPADGLFMVACDAAAVLAVIQQSDGSYNAVKQISSYEQRERGATTGYQETGVSGSGTGFAGGLFDRAGAKQQVRGVIKPELKPAIERIFVAEQPLEEMTEEKKNKLADTLAVLEALLAGASDLVGKPSKKDKLTDKEKAVVAVNKSVGECRELLVECKKQLGELSTVPSVLEGRIQTLKTKIEAAYRKFDKFVSDGYDKNWISKYIEIWNSLDKAIEADGEVAEYVAGGMVSKKDLLVEAQKIAGQSVVAAQQLSGGFTPQRVISEALTRLV